MPGYHGSSETGLGLDLDEKGFESNSGWLFPNYDGFPSCWLLPVRQRPTILQPPLHFELRICIPSRSLPYSGTDMQLNASLQGLRCSNVWLGSRDHQSQEEPSQPQRCSLTSIYAQYSQGSSLRPRLEGTRGPAQVACLPPSSLPNTKLTSVFTFSQCLLPYQGSTTCMPACATSVNQANSMQSLI